MTDDKEDILNQPINEEATEEITTDDYFIDYNKQTASTAGSYHSMVVDFSNDSLLEDILLAQAANQFLLETIREEGQINVIELLLALSDWLSSHYKETVFIDRDKLVEMINRCVVTEEEGD